MALCVNICAAISKSNEDDAPSFAQLIYPLNATARLQNLLVGIESGANVDDRVAETRRFLSLTPSDARFYSVLGSGEARLGHRAPAEALFNTALRLSQTELNAAINVISANLKTQDYAQALRRADILLRRWPDRIAGFSPALRDIAANSKDGRDSLVQVLAKKPTWRIGFMMDLTANRETLPVLPAIFAQLQQSPGPATDPEVAAAVGALLAAGQPRLAYQLYTLTLDKDERALAGMVYNAKFVRAPNGSEFDWRVFGANGVEVTIPAQAEGGAKIEFLDQPAVGAGIFATTVLFPGDYTLSIKIDARGLVTPEPLVASVECRTGQKLATLAIPPGTYAQKTLTSSVAVPATQCEAQVLRFATAQVAPRWSKAYSGDLVVHEASLARAISE